jgi:hypothetical protein
LDPPCVFHSPPSTPTRPVLDTPRRLTFDSSDSDSLPSPTNPQTWFPTPKTPKTSSGRGYAVGDGSPRASRDRGPVRCERTVGGFFESPGGTFHEVES